MKLLRMLTGVPGKSTRPTESVNMKHRFFPCRLLLSLIMTSTFAIETRAQEKTADRWEKDIVQIEARIAEGKSPQKSVVFVGSSSIRLWKLEKSLPKLQASNHGFGGSYLSDTVHFFDRIVAPVHPSTIVVYAGDNDIAAMKSPETVHKDFLALAARVEKDLPDCRKLIYIAIKPSVKRWALATEIQKANALIAATCAQNPRLEFVDVWTPMLKEDGMPNADLLLEDGLHMNEKGYQIWTDALLPHLSDIASN